jgi:hypothetical protein
LVTHLGACERFVQRDSLPRVSSRHDDDIRPRIPT